MESYGPVEHRIFEAARVESFKHPLLDMCGGPVLAGAGFDRYRHRRQDRPCDSFAGVADHDGHLPGEWVYLGPKYHHFGHIMSEMVHRIVPSKLLFPDTRRYLLVTTFDDAADAGFGGLCRAWQEALHFCEIDPAAVRILNTNSIVERLAICEQGSNLGGHASPWYLQALAEFSARRLDELHSDRPSSERVYVSKSRIPHGGTILGESYIEELLREEGFFILHPQEEPLSVQMDTYRKARLLVFSEGSACHGTELLGTGMLEQTVVLVRRMEMQPDLGKILAPRSREFEMFLETFLLGTIAVHPQTRLPHSEFAVSLLDIDRFVAYFRERRFARLDGIAVERYFEAAERDLRTYFSYHMGTDVAAVDPWRVGEVRLEFEKVRRRFLAGRPLAPLAVAQTPLADADAANIEQQAWAAHVERKWLTATGRWEIFRERFPHALAGFTLGSIALIELGRFYEADAVLREALEKFPDQHEVHSTYALVAQHRRDWREAVARWDAYRSLFPEMAVGYALGAAALCEMGRHEAADSLVEAGLDRHPEHEELLEKHAWIAHLRGDPERAGERLGKLKTLHPGNPTAFSVTATTGS